MKTCSSNVRESTNKNLIQENLLETQPKRRKCNSPTRQTTSRAGPGCLESNYFRPPKDNTKNKVPSEEWYQCICVRLIHSSWEGRTSQYSFKDTPKHAMFKLRLRNNRCSIHHISIHATHISLTLSQIHNIFCLEFEMYI